MWRAGEEILCDPTLGVWRLFVGTDHICCDGHFALVHGAVGYKPIIVSPARRAEFEEATLVIIGLYVSKRESSVVG